MKKLLIFLGSLLTLVLVVVVGVAVWVLTFDPNENKDWIAQKFREQTGRELVLGGDVSLSIYPWLGIEANDIAVGNAVGFSADPLFSARHVATRIKLMPLISGRYEIDTVRLDGVRVLLEVAGNGQNNWASLAGAGGADGEAASGGGGGGNALLGNLVIGGVSITDAGVIYDDRFANVHYEVSDFNLTVAELVYGQPLDINMNFLAAASSPQLAADTRLAGTVLYDMDEGRYNLSPLELVTTLSGPSVPDGSAELRLNSAVALDLEADTLQLDNFRIELPGASIGMELSASRVQTGTPSLNARLDARGDDLALLFRILEQEALAQRISSLDSSFVVSASVEADMRSGELQVPGFEASLLNASIRGDLRAQRFNTETPLLSGKLNASGPDLPTLVEVAGMLQGGSNSPLSQAGRDMRSGAQRDFSVDVDFAADLQAGTVAVPQLQLALLGANVSGRVNASNIDDTEKLRAEGEFSATGPDLPLLMQVAGQVAGGRESPLYQYGEKLRLGVQDRAFTLGTEFNADLGRGQVVLPRFSARLLGFEATANLNASNLNDNNGLISGALQLQGRNLREVLSAIDQAELGEVAQSLTLELQLGGSTSNLRLSPLQLSAVVAGPRIPNSPQTLSLDADTTLNLERGNLDAQSFTLRGLGLNLSGSVNATNINSSPSFRGRLDLPAFNARQFLAQLNQSLPPMADETTLRSVALTTEFGGSASSFNLNDLELKLDESTITGDFAVSDFDSMATTFAFNIDSIDADRYMAPTTEEEVQAAGEPEPLPVDTLRSLNIDGRLQVGELVVSKLHMRDIEIGLKAQGGEIALYPFQAALYEGNFTGDIRLDARSATPQARVDTRLVEVNLEPLLMDFMDATYATGIANIQLSLAGQGADTPAIKRSLNGSGSLQLEDGVLQGVDVGAVLSTVETMIRQRQILPLPEGGSTPFEESAATLAIREGVVSTQDLAIKAPGWQLTGNGTLANLNNDSINFSMLVAVDRSTVTTEETEYDLGGYNLPIACTGALSGPRCLPDTQQIIAGAIGNAVQRRLTEFLQDRQGDTGQAAGQQQAAPAPQQALPDGQEAPLPAEEPADATEVLINRALDRLFGN